MALLQTAAGREPRRWRRRVPAPVRNALVSRLGHPTDPFDATVLPRRLNLGAGWDNRDGYLNVDAQSFHSPDLVADVRTLPQLPSGFYEEIVAQDVLEHFDRADVPRALLEWRRLLAPGGVLRLRVPDLPALLHWIDTTDDAERQRELMHLLFGTQAYEGDYHHAGFTDVLLPDELHRAGFARIEFDRHEEWWLWEGTAHAAADGETESAIALLWTKGFDQLARGDDGTARRSGEREGELMLYARRAGPATLNFEVLGGATEISGGGVEASLPPGEHQVALELEQGANRVRLATAAAALELGGTVTVTGGAGAD